MFGSKEEKQKGMNRSTQMSLIIFVLILAFLVALWGWDVTDKQLDRTRAQTIQASCSDLSTEKKRTRCENTLDDVSETIDQYRQRLEDAQ